MVESLIACQGACLDGKSLIHDVGGTCKDRKGGM